MPQRRRKTDELDAALDRLERLCAKYFKRVEATASLDKCVRRESDHIQAILDEVRRDQQMMNAPAAEKKTRRIDDDPAEQGLYGDKDMPTEDRGDHHQPPRAHDTTSNAPDDPHFWPNASER